MIEFRKVEKRYGEATAIAGVNLNIPSGKVTALIGPSGCGKSTLLRLILGLLEPTSGQVVVDGKTVTSATAQDLRRHSGYVIQDGGLFPHLTVEENVTLMGRHLGQAVDVNRLTELARFPSDALKRYPNELSGGQKQRVGLMRALALSPKLLLLDEPLGALDPLVRSSLQQDLKQIFKEFAQTVVLVTHDMGEAAYLADHIVLLRDGRVIQEGELEDFQKRPSEPFVTEFLNAQRQLVAL
jgi:osmoprotectant transport system ATP-binding protein